MWKMFIFKKLFIFLKMFRFQNMFRFEKVFKCQFFKYFEIIFLFKFWKNKTEIKKKYVRAGPRNRNLQETAHGPAHFLWLGRCSGATSLLNTAISDEKELSGLAGLIPRSTDSTVQRRATGRILHATPHLSAHYSFLLLFLFLFSIFPSSFLFYLLCPVFFFFLISFLKF
jgi:hypothetical protein